MCDPQRREFGVFYTCEKRKTRGGGRYEHSEHGQGQAAIDRCWDVAGRWRMPMLEESPRRGVHEGEL
jgi:hypothetical protein